MTDLNSDRELVALLREICAEHGVRLSEFSDAWLLLLEKDGRSTHVFGYDFSINNAASRLIAKDKAATAALLKHCDVPAVEHQIFHSPQLADYVPMSGNWPLMIDFFRRHNQHVVCKPNEGTGGIGVSRAQTLVELEKAVMQLFRQCRSICLSPYKDIDEEYRVAVLNNRVEFIYCKQRPYLLGDGHSSVRDLVASWISRQDEFTVVAKVLADLVSIPRETLDRVPALNESIEVNWRHNLGQGAEPVVIDSGNNKAREVVDLALRAANALRINLASVDIVDVGGHLQVLEVNSGIMMESFARSNDANRARAKRFYAKIVEAALNLTECE